MRFRQPRGCPGAAGGRAARRAEAIAGSGVVREVGVASNRELVRASNKTGVPKAAGAVVWTRTTVVRLRNRIGDRDVRPEFQIKRQRDAARTGQSLRRLSPGG